MNTNKKVLFLGHEATRTGAPLLLLQLVSWLKIHADLRPEVLLLDGGPLRDQYQQSAPTTLWNDRIAQFNCSFFRTWLRRVRLLPWRDPEWCELYRVAEYPLIYANTVVTLPKALKFSGNGRKIILHIHELQSVVDHYAAKDLLRRSSDQVSCFIAASAAVEQFLVRDIGVPAEKIRVVHEFTDARSESTVSRAASRLRFGLADTDFAIGMCGSMFWRKGTDLFVRLAQILKGRDAAGRCRLLWLGGAAGTQREILYDLEKLELTGMCRFLPESDGTQEFYAALDLFALTSREDPFPVAMLEAAAAGLPIVCFQDSGGGPEFVGGEAGVCVAYADVEAMARACLELMKDEKRRLHLGESARRSAVGNYSLQTQAPKILCVIEDVLQR